MAEYIDSDGELWGDHPEDPRRVVFLDGADEELSQGVWLKEVAMRKFALSRMDEAATPVVYLVEMIDGSTEKYSTEDGEIELTNHFFMVDYPDEVTISIPTSAIRKVTQLPVEG